MSDENETIKERVERGDPTAKRYRRVEGIAAWAIPGVDANADELPDRIPDHALEAMPDERARGIRERRENAGQG